MANLFQGVVSLKQNYNSNNSGVYTSIQWTVTHLAHAYQMWSFLSILSNSPDIGEEL